MVFHEPTAQLSSVPQSCPTLCDPTDCSTPGLPVLHQLSELFFPFPEDQRFLTLSSVQLLSRVQLFATPQTAACQASMSIINSQSLPKLMSNELVMPSNHLILCCPLLLLPSIFPSIRVFFSESVLHIGGQSIGASVSASVLPMNIQD